MSIKPVDFQIMLPRTSEMSRIRNDEQQKNESLQQHQINTIQHKVDNSLKQVYSQDKSQEVGIREKQEREGRQKREGKQENKEKNRKQEDGKKLVKSDVKASTIDIRL